MHDPFLRRKQDIMYILGNITSKISIPTASMVLLRRLEDTPKNLKSSLKMLIDLREFLEQPLNRAAIIQ